MEMKKCISCFLCFFLVSSSFGVDRQRELLDFLISYGDELQQSTEMFLHEQRRLGHEQQLHSLEKGIIDVEVLVDELRNRTVIDPNDEKAFHDLHQIEHKLIDAENLVVKEIERIKRVTGQISTQPTTPNPTVTTPHHVIDELLHKVHQTMEEATQLLKTYHGIERSTIVPLLQVLHNLLPQYEAHHGQQVITEMIGHETALRLAVQRAKH